MRLPQAVIGQRSTRSLEINQRGSKRLWGWKYLVLTSNNDQMGLALTPISWMGKLRLSVLENMAKVKGGWRWSQVSVNLNLLVKEPSGVSALPREGRGAEHRAGQAGALNSDPKSRYLLAVPGPSMVAVPGTNMVPDLFKFHFLL